MKRKLIFAIGFLVYSVAATGPVRATILTFDIFDSTLYPNTEDFPEGYGFVAGFSNQNPLSGYGSNVTGPTGIHSNGTTDFNYDVGAEGYTPDITVGYGPISIFTGGPALWRYDYGDLERVLFQGSTYTGVGTDYNHLDIVFTAAAGWDVELFGFDLGGWNQTDYIINALIVYDGIPFPFLTPTNQISPTPLSPQEVLGAGPTHTSITFGTPLKAQQIWLTIDASNLQGFESEFIGIDNIRFGQVENQNNTSTPPAPPLEGDNLDRFAVPEPGSLVLFGIGLAGLSAMRRRRE